MYLRRVRLVEIYELLRSSVGIELGATGQCRGWQKRRHPKLHYRHYAVGELNHKPFASTLNRLLDFNE
jgi:hypothetical protein